MSAERKQCVFLIDDEDTYRDVLAMLLDDQGYTTVEASTLADARVILAERRPFDAVFLDASLPDGGGLSLLPEIRAARPEAKIVLLSGTGDIEAAGPDEDLAARVLKGGDPEDLLALLRGILSA